MPLTPASSWRAGRVFKQQSGKLSEAEMQTPHFEGTLSRVWSLRCSSALSLLFLPPGVGQGEAGPAAGQ